VAEGRAGKWEGKEERTILTDEKKGRGMEKW